MMHRLILLGSVFCLGAMTCLLTGPALAQTSNLLISEYVEGSGNNQAVEIFNGTGDLIDLGAYSLERYSNGSTTPVSIALTMVDLQPGETWVMVNSLAEPDLLALADQIHDDLIFDGNDTLVLTYTGSEVVDSFGQVGVDPGDFWACSGGSTQNHTLRRISYICAGDTIIDDAFDPCLEFSFFPADVFTGLGIHFADCGVVDTESTSWGTLKANFR